MSNNTKKPIILKRMIIKPGSGKLPIKSDFRNVKQNLFKLATIPLYREDVIFESKGETYIGDYQSVTIKNKLNNLTNNCQTIAHCTTKQQEVIVKTSDNVSQVIGQEAYNTLFYALCSVINQEYRIKGILSLLTVKRNTPLKLAVMGTNNKACQTDETRLLIKSKRSRKRVRKPLVPYAVKPDTSKVKKLTVIPENCVPLELREKIKKDDHSAGFVPIQEKIEPPTDRHSVTCSSELFLPDLGNLDGSDSIKSFSALSFQTIPELMLNPLSLVDNVEKHTQESTVIEKIEMNHRVVLMDGTEILLRYKPEDNFHVATEDNLKHLDDYSKKKLLLHQMHIDFKFCLTTDEDGNLPIHEAVMSDDIALLKRQCAVLNIRKQSVDVPTTNGLTALKLSLFRESALATSLLLAHGADPFQDVEELSLPAHRAAELHTDHLAHILNHCKIHARSIIVHHAEELQTPGWEEKSDDELSSILLDYMCSSFNKQGYTPLMLASNLGLYENTRLLAECSPRTVDLVMPTSGNTALYLAVAAACTLAAERGNKSKIVDHFRKTIEILLDFGANPSSDNNGTSVNTLLQEFNCAELSMLVANRITHNRFNDEDPSRNFDEFLLMKDGDNVTLQELKKYNRKNKNEPVTVNKEKVKTENNLNLVSKSLVKIITKDIKTDKVMKDANRPIITENIVLEPNKSKTDVKIKVGKLETVPVFRKVIWCRAKRKSDASDTKDTKIKKT